MLKLGNQVLFLVLSAYSAACWSAGAGETKRAPSLKPVKFSVPADAKTRQPVKKPVAPSEDPEREIWKHHGVG